MGGPKNKVVLAVHGGAGIILRDSLGSDQELQYRSALQEALLAGYNVLHYGQSKDVALDAAEAAVKCMEQCPLFNAGRGSVFANDGKIRMDASIMACYLERSNNKQETTHGESPVPANNTITSPHQIIQQRKYPKKPHPKAGAVAGVCNVQNPISLARQVMERTPHVILIGKGAEDFARSLPAEVGVKFQPDKYFWTERRWNQLMSVRSMENNQSEEPGDGVIVQLDHSATHVTVSSNNDAHKFGTVGCVALYRPDPKQTELKAQLASATSTGGMTNQRYSRVGDSPIIGAGTYADSLCAVSCTGHGEWFIRCVAAHDVVKRLEYKYGNDDDRGAALQKSVDEVVVGTLMGDGDIEGGDGGLIALDRYGNFAANMNCSGMYHGWIYEDGKMETRIFWDEEA
jgi:beta-aspartyl-peptidase (threonine type)